MIPLKVKLYAAGAVLVVLAYFTWQGHQRAIGARDALLKAKDAELAVLKRETRKIDTLYVRQRDTLRLTRQRTDTILRAITDTVIRVDSVRVIVERERQACDAVLSTCERRVAVRDSTIKNLERQVGLLKKSGRTFTDRIGVTVGYGVTLYGDGEIAQGPQVGVSIRVLP